ncbi:MAG: ABC-type transport system, ATP-binding component [Candidatus Levybacteria bacterium GW2011_GWB1_35_5]|nr:MAG: ABC-type transport system, ATP-binding component [Candidatus Levybacteria bacterium GW2011_GWB1_35_5]
MSQKVLEVKNLTKKFGKFTAVNNISFDIKEGEILGLLGPNGAGKTTTIHMLLDVMDPTNGSISYFGKPLKGNRSEILKKLNFSSAYISLPWLFTVEEVLNVFANLYEVPNKQTRIKRLLSEFEIEHLRKKSIHMLSAGEMARLLLTKAFINYPKIILLDEPTASLDPDIAVKIREFLRRQQKEYKVSMLFTSHNMSEVEEMCDNIVFLNKGKIIAKDKPENLSKQIPESEVEFITINILKAKKFLESQKISFVQNKNTFRINIKTKDISTFITSMTNEKIEYEDISINKPNLEDYFLKMSQRSKV